MIVKELLSTYTKWYDMCFILSLLGQVITKMSTRKDALSQISITAMMNFAKEGAKEEGSK